MPKGTPITFYERERIEVWLRMKKKKTWIANKLNRDYSVMYSAKNKGIHRCVYALLSFVKKH